MYIKDSVNTKFLGLQSDNYLNWKNHIDQTLSKTLEILALPHEYIFSLMDFTMNSHVFFQTNSTAHSVNTRNKHELHRPIANLSCFQKS
jgi:hypothetical protein